MRLIGFDDGGKPTIGVVAGGGVTAVAGLDEFWADPVAGLRRAEGLSVPARPLDEAVQVVPVPPTSKVLCVGLNYRQHAREAGLELPAAPNLFGRWASTLTVTNAPVPVPVGEPELDWEGELALVVGRTLRGATVEEAREAILFCACFNDLTARRHQFAVSQWALGKNADLSAPMGPALVTVDEAGDYESLALATRVNGETVQSSKTSDMIFSPAEVLSYASNVMTLQPGDVLTTGTPEGIGFMRTPPVLLQPGDRVEVEIGELGVLSNPIAAAAPPG